MKSLLPSHIERERDREPVSEWVDRLDLGLREQSVGWALNGDSGSQSRHITEEGGESLTTFKFPYIFFFCFALFCKPYVLLRISASTDKRQAAWCSLGHPVRML